MTLQPRHDSVFRHYNQELVQVFCYFIAALLGTVLLFRKLTQHLLAQKLRHCEYLNESPSRQQLRIVRYWSILTSIIRGISYSQIHFQGVFSWLSPPSAGKDFLLIIYWSLLTFMLTYKAIIHDSEYYERIGFRAAWISVTQVPLIYLLSAKASVLGYFVGSSYERLNWLHRWVSRTLLVTVTIHGGFFMREWIKVDFFWSELRIMPMVTYGIIAWFILVWTFLSSLSPFRSMAYELFVLQHIVSAVVFLWLLWRHVPSHASYFIWISVGAFSGDWVISTIVSIYCNVHSGGIGYRLQLTADDDDITTISLENVLLSWKPGQHIRLWIPRLGPLQSHPYTIATPCLSANRSSKNNLTFIVRTYSGISKTMNKYAKRPQPYLRAFISSPYGSSPAWNAYETLVLIAASTGGSFTLPILESIVNDPMQTCVSRIRFLLLARRRGHIEFYLQRLPTSIARAAASGIYLAVEITITSRREDEGPLSEEDEQKLLYNSGEEDVEKADWSNSEGDSYPLEPGFQHISKAEDEEENENAALNPAQEDQASSRGIFYTRGRPLIAEYLKSPLEYTKDEAMVVVCGGKPLISEVRNCVAGLLRTGAPVGGTAGIHLYTEEYGL
ncbi:uncharacterized protein LY89DRAFT_787383 [Mollisia scopiformis]|uniref:ferric-chelate reductase (NADPH) n=1 Tax=Mollisia scopiformis TaxID=149040 RepID=A0A132BEP5_MOLSC|nr:uncharacterized protein LY89DRAFT_787383 [Mollisia scopiformis]KUJ10324.1 hypothetical protein LY89DRAFT_787383 [Mollisia scopiformis]